MANSTGDAGKAVSTDQSVLNQSINDCLNAIFEPFEDSDDIAECDNALVGLQNLSGIYLRHKAPLLLENKAVHFDYFGATEALMRFQRDAYGVYRFHNFVEGLRLHKERREALLAQVRKMGIRINSPRPQEERTASVFSLWMSTFRPISVIPQNSPAYTRSSLVHLNANITHWISCLYLAQYGKVVHRDGTSDHCLERIRYDLTYRSLTLSSLEMLYCSIFIPNVKLEAT